MINDSNDLLNTPICEEDDNELKPVKMAINGNHFDVVTLEDIMDIPIDGYLTEMDLNGETAAIFKRKRIIDPEGVESIVIPITSAKIKVRDRYTREVYYLVNGSYITDIDVFAGKGSKPYKKFEKAIWLVDQFPETREKDWFHAKGNCNVIDNDGNQGSGELHWAECHGVGAVLRDVKEWWTMPEESKGNKSVKEQTEHQIGVITESGIVFENGSIISSGKVVEIARQCKQLLSSGNESGFEKLMQDEGRKLDTEDRRILINTVITDQGATVLEVLIHLD